MNVYRAAVVAGGGDSTRAEVQRHRFSKLRECLPADMSPSPFAPVPAFCKDLRKVVTELCRALFSSSWVKSHPAFVLLSGVFF